MSRTITAVRFNGQITPIHLIENKLIEKVIYYGRKPLRGEYKSRGVIKTDSIIKGTISLRLTNDTAPIMLFLITGKQTDYRHVPETRNLFKQTLTPDYENPLQFSLIEIKDETAYETPNLYVTGFTITQEGKAPLKLEINLETKSSKAEVIRPEIDTPESSKFFYLPQVMKIHADLENKATLTIDSKTQLTEEPLVIEAYSRAEYEPNRYGRFTININNYQFEKKLESNGYYRNQCYGEFVFRKICKGIGGGISYN